MKEFLIDNWRIIAELVLLVGSTVLFIVRKKPVKVVDTLKATILRLLPVLINRAENTGLKNEAKLNACIDELVLILKELGYGDDIIVQYLAFAKVQVEAILSTPQAKKKGI